MECPVCTKRFTDELTPFCPRCGWLLAPGDEGHAETRLEIARERWGEVEGLRRAVAELQAEVVRRTSPGAEPRDAPEPGRVLEEPLTGMELVCVAGARFSMGDVFGDREPDERPVHAVSLASYCLGRYPVTQAQWEAVAGHNPSAHPGSERPVDSVSWEDCREFLAKLSEKSGVHFRFPTEAEWEYAARSGGGLDKWAGTSREDEVNAFAWFVGNSRGSSQPVGLKRPNRLGFHDMSGNVWEWCQDWYGERYYGASPEEDPPGAPAGARRVARGGSWADDRELLLTVWRGALQPGFRLKTHGLRVAVSWEAAAALR